MLPLYPLRFLPQFEYRPWGGRQLEGLMGSPLPGEAAVGEAWLLSDRDEHPSVVAEGALRGTSLRRLIQDFPARMLGAGAATASRFPLLLKFLDVSGTLSVQVHPADDQAALLPPGESGKTEAWVVLHAGDDSRVYAGLAPGMTGSSLRAAVDNGDIAQQLASFTPRVGDAILIPAGTVHCLRDVLVFEVQENSDVTFRLYDWDRIDGSTQALRPLQAEQALASVTFPQPALRPLRPVVESAEPVLRERLLDCSHFGLVRIRAAASFMVGAQSDPCVLVCIGGQGQVMHEDSAHPLRRGDTMLVPADIGPCRCIPQPSITLLQVTMPQRS